jgi:fructose-1,6-bisphosphatase I
MDIACRLRTGPLESDQALSNAARQQATRAWASNRLAESLKKAFVAAILSRDLDEPLYFDKTSPVAVAFEPLSGSYCLDANVPVGTVFSVLPVNEHAESDAIFLQPGSKQLASGYVIYGSQCALVLTAGQGTQMFTLDPETQQFVLTDAKLEIDTKSNEYAINASNYRHWTESLRAYIDDLIEGTEGPRGRDVSMRWIGSMVAECHRIFARGGIFLYPRDARKGYEKGRIRLIYEANPVAFLVEQAGGKAFDGRIRLLDIQPASLHQRTPVYFGSAKEVDWVSRYKIAHNTMYTRSPLFKKRGLLRT